MVTKTIAYKLEHDEPILRFAYIIYGPFKGYNVELLEKQKKAAFRKLSNGKTEYRQEIWFNVRIETSNITELVDPRILVNTEKNVLGYEPHIALFVEDANPIVFYQEIITHAKLYLKRNGWLFFEIHPNFSAEIVSYLKNHGFVNIELMKDLQGRIRMLKGQNA